MYVALILVLRVGSTVDSVYESRVLYSYRVLIM